MIEDFKTDYYACFLPKKQKSPEFPLVSEKDKDKKK